MQPPITVTELTSRVKALVHGAESVTDIWVTGEIGSYSLASSGHCYFTLKDQECDLRCVMWKGQARLLNWAPKQGDMVNAYGYVSVYERAGAYQFYAQTVTRGGVGLLWQEFARLKARLDAEGLFDPGLKRALPEYPECIGVVTSPTGAALQDILKVLGSRYRPAEVLVSPTPVQGAEAPEQIVRAIRRVDAEPRVDVIIVARGGGSIEDLWAFNDERVARAIRATSKPVVTGIGHETDVSIADYVADAWAPTPSVAASSVVPDGEVLKERIGEHVGRMGTLIAQRLNRCRADVQQQERVLRTFEPQRVIGEKRQRLDDRVNRLVTSMQHSIALHRAGLARQTSRLESLDARQVLGRGFSLVELRGTGERLDRIEQVKSGDGVRVYVRDGRVEATVTGTTAHAAYGETES